MDKGDHARLVAGRRKVDAVSAHLLVERGEKRLITQRGGGKIRDFLLAEIGAEHGSKGGHLNRHALGCQNVAQFHGKGMGALFKRRVVGGFEVAQGGYAGSHCQRIARKRARLIYAASGRDEFHVTALAAKGTHGQTAANDLAKGGEVGIYAEAGLRAAKGRAKAGDDFVKNEQAAVLVADGAQAFKKAGLGQHKAHVGGHRLHNDGGDARAMLLKDGLDGINVIVRSKQGVGHNGCGHAGSAGNGERGKARTGGGEEGVGVAVVAAHKLEHLVPLGGGAGQAQGAHGGLCAGVDHAHHFKAGHGGNHFFGQGYFCRAGSAVAGAAFGGLAHGPGDGRFVMPKDHGAPGEYKVDILVAVHIGNPAAVSFGYEQGLAVHVVAGAHRAVDAAGNNRAGLFKKLPRSGIHQRLLVSGKIGHGNFFQFLEAAQHGMLAQQGITLEVFHHAKAFGLAAAMNHGVEFIRPVGRGTRAVVDMGDMVVQGGLRAALFHQIGVDLPGHHGVVRPAGFLVFDAGSKTADCPGFLERTEQLKHLGFCHSCLFGNICVWRERIRQVVLHDAQHGLFCGGKLTAHEFSGTMG